MFTELLQLAIQKFKRIFCKNKKPLRIINADLIDEDELGVAPVIKSTAQQKKPAVKDSQQGSTSNTQSLLPKSPRKSRSSISSIFPMGTLLAASRLMPIAAQNCEHGDPIYFTTSYDNRVTGVYAIQAAAFYADIACKWIERALNNGGPYNITQIHTSSLPLGEAFAHMCYEDNDPPPDPLLAVSNLTGAGYSVYLFPANGTSNVVSPALQYLIAQIKRDCFDPGTQAIAYIYIGILAVAGLVIAGVVLYFFYSGAKGGVKYIGEKIGEKIDERRAMQVMSELGSAEGFQTKKGPLHLVLEYLGVQGLTKKPATLPSSDSSLGAGDSKGETNGTDAAFGVKIDIKAPLLARGSTNGNYQSLAETKDDGSQTETDTNGGDLEAEISSVLGPIFSDDESVDWESTSPRQSF